MIKNCVSSGLSYYVLLKKCVFFFLFLLFIRCRIPECESLNATDYNTDWLNHAIPLKNGRPDKCSRYAASHAPITFQSKHCSPSMFNQSDIINCNQYVFKTDEYRIMREVS